MQTSMQAGWRVMMVLWCLAVGWAGCAQTSVKQTLDRHSLGDGDLLALLPRGQDALLDVDVVGLRQLAAVPTLMTTKASAGMPWRCPMASRASMSQRLP